MPPREWANVFIRRPEVKRESVFLTVPPDVPRAWQSMRRKQRPDGRVTSQKFVRHIAVG